MLRGWGTFQIMADYGRDKQFERTPSRLVEELEIRPGGEYNVNLPFPTPWSRSFLVQDSAGNPLPAVRIQLNTRALDGFGGDSYSVDQTDSEGRATLSSLDPGYEISVRFRKDGYLRADTEYLSGKPGATLPMETIVLQRVPEAVATLVDGNNVAFADRQVKVYLYADGDLGRTIDTSTDGQGRIRRDSHIQIADLLPDAGEISFELEIENPPMEGQDGALYRSDHLLLPADETEDMGTIVLRIVGAGAG